ncbi:hypothetical protein XFEB_01078 [Xylella fastidiosa EB92.1]|nr:hypothetical protein XFEB_01078 [Xylella fastidiosa EB92.1]
MPGSNRTMQCTIWVKQALLSYHLMKSTRTHALGQWLQERSHTKQIMLKSRKALSCHVSLYRE